MLIAIARCWPAAASTCRAASRCRQAFAYTYIDTKDEQTDFVQDLRKALIASGVEGDPHPGIFRRHHQRARG